MKRFNLSYGPGSAMRYDEYPPRKGQNAPIVMFWHGGSWRRGNKRTYRFIGHWLRRIGVHAIIVEYPRYPEQTFPGFIDDIELAINHIADKYPDKNIYLMGHSAGAHIISIAAMSRKKLPIAGCIAISTPCNIGSKHYSHIFDEKTFKAHLENPQTYAAKARQDIDYLLIHGRRDKIVSVNDSKILHKKLSSSQHNCQLRLEPYGHIMILPAIAFGLANKTNLAIKKILDV